MKSSIKILSLLFIAFFTLASCSKDDDPVDNNLFIGRYEGTVSFTDINNTDANVTPKEGHVTVAKVGDKYSFNFSDGIPTIKDIVMKKGDGNTIIFGDGAIGTISISESKLTIAYATNGKTWSANCDR